ncbi:MAG: T9SS type A sorting domain-containing protein [Bacteroidota bacterium]
MKKILLFITAITAACQSYAQLEVIDTNNITRERWRDSVFRMDKNQVPTGFLLEYSMFGLESNKYDGTGNDDDTIKNDGRIFELHNTLWYSKVNNNATIDLTDSVFSKAFFANLNSDVIPLTFVYQNYNRIRQSSLSEGLFTITPDSVGIVDVPGRQISPYDNYELFAFAPFKTKITRFNAIPFTLPNELFYMQGINTVEIDFDDGAGFRTLTKGSTVNIYYNTEGLKYLTARITTANGTRIAKCMVDYKRPAEYVQPDYSWNIEVDPVYTDDNQYLGGNKLRTSELVNPCDYGSMIDKLMCLQKPNANIRVVNGCDRVFDKPIIIVEGFDPTNDLTIDEMVRRFSQRSFMATMQAYGYDFVFVDFTKNTTYIENNAKVLEAVINKVNQTKVGNFKSTVIGFSMGGLIARWCLKDMEDRGLQHNVENYFSYDAPHQGANIPLGMQYIFKEMVRDLPYLRWNNSLRKLDDAFKSPAAKQMLVTYADYNHGPFNWFPNLNTLNNLRAAFASRLQAKGYPQQTRNFGMAFGRGDNTPNTKNAGNGNQFTNANPFHPKDDIFWGGLFTLLVNAEAQGSAVPENNEKATIAYYSFFGITFRKIFGIPFPTVTLRVRRFDYTGQYPYDDAMGSFEQTQTDFVQSWFGGLSGSPTTFGHDGHNFVSTASALDLQNQGYSSANNWQSGNMFLNVDNQILNPGQVGGNTPLTLPTSFNAVITGTSDCASIGCSTPEPYTDENSQWVYPTNVLWNHFHNADITYQFAQFIERNILNSQPINCAGGNGLCNRNPTISGPDLMCTTGQYELINLPSGIRILWESQNGNFRIDNGQGTNRINVSKVQSGTDVVKVTLTNDCGASLVLTNPITVGTPSPTIAVLSYDRRCGTFLEAQTSTLPSATGYIWNLNFGQVIEDGTDYFYVSPLVYNPQIGFTYYNYLSVQARNTCGVSDPSATRQATVGPVPSSCGGGQLRLSPNPTSSTLTVEAINNSEFTKLRIVDKMGQVKKQFNYAASKKATLNVTDLPTDVYRIQALINNNWTTVSFIKQ